MPRLQYFLIIRIKPWARLDFSETREYKHLFLLPIYPQFHRVISFCTSFIFFPKCGATFCLQTDNTRKSLNFQEGEAQKYKGTQHQREYKNLSTNLINLTKHAFPLYTLLLSTNVKYIELFFPNWHFIPVKHCSYARRKQQREKNQKSLSLDP